MDFSKVGMFLILLAHGFLLTSYPVRSNEFVLLIPKTPIEHEDDLLQWINKYRKSLKLCALTRNEKAACLGDQIANVLEVYDCDYGRRNRACKLPGDPSTMVLKIVDFPRLLRKCHINVTTALDAIILPTCIDEPIDVYVTGVNTSSSCTKYLRNAVYTGVGIGSHCCHWDGSLCVYGVVLGTFL